MTSHPITPAILGHQAEAAIADDVGTFDRVLGRLGPDDWERPTAAGGAPVATVVAHLAEGAERLAEAWSHQVDAEPNDVLLHTFDDPDVPPSVASPPDDPADVLAAYRSATRALRDALNRVREQDWVWPVWSPLGGVETLAEAARRWVSHHHVHRDDVLAAVNRHEPVDDDTVRLVAEFVLDAIARRGAEDVEPMIFEVVAGLPGAGTWSLVIDEPEPRPEIRDIWSQLLAHRPQPTQRHRLERGSAGRARVRIDTTGELLWRAAFRRGADWSELVVHGDDHGRAQWEVLLDRLAAATHGALGRVQH